MLTRPEGWLKCQKTRQILRTMAPRTQEWSISQWPPHRGNKALAAQHPCAYVTHARIALTCWARLSRLPGSRDLGWALVISSSSLMILWPCLREMCVERGEWGKGGDVFAREPRNDATVSHLLMQPLLINKAPISHGTRSNGRDETE